MVGCAHAGWAGAHLNLVGQPLGDALGQAAPGDGPAHGGEGGGAGGGLGEADTVRVLGLWLAGQY